MVKKSKGAKSQMPFYAVLGAIAVIGIGVIG